VCALTSTVKCALGRNIKQWNVREKAALVIVRFML